MLNQKPGYYSQEDYQIIKMYVAEEVIAHQSDPAFHGESKSGQHQTGKALAVTVAQAMKARGIFLKK